MKIAAPPKYPNRQFHPFPENWMLLMVGIGGAIHLCLPKTSEPHELSLFHTEPWVNSIYARNLSPGHTLPYANPI